MGYREWRERQNARIDAMTARADERVARMEKREAEVRSEQLATRVEREAAAVDTRLAALRAEAARLGEDHDDLAARAVAVGMPPAPPAPRRRGWVEMAGEVLASEGAPAGERQASPYELWWGRIREEERCAAKLARGESLSLVDRARLRLARVEV